jgi:hypothetical protein
MVLQPIAMVKPTRDCVYTPSRLRQERTIPYAAFLRQYADTARVILVSFDEDGISDPQPVTAYGRGLDCWYIVVPVTEAGGEGD